MHKEAHDNVDDGRRYEIHKHHTHPLGGIIVPKTVGNCPKTLSEPSESAPNPTLTVKQQRFVKGYLIDLNAAGAARRAGYSRRTARQMGTENLSKPYIRAIIDAEIEARKARLSVKAEQVIRGHDKRSLRVAIG